MVPVEVANIDFDIFLYKYGFGYQKTYYVIMDGDNIFEEFTAKSKAKKRLKELEGQGFVLESYIKADPLPIVFGALNKEIAQILENTGAHSYQGFLTGPGNYRMQLATINTYKKSRKDLTKPVHYQAIKEWLIREHKAILTNGIEADDALGIAQDPNGSTILCSIDKDLRITPGRHYNLTSGEISIVDEFGSIELIEKNGVRELKGGGKKFHYAQMIMGDSCDDIPGINGKGSVFAYNLLNDCTSDIECFNKVSDVYKETYGEHYLPLMVQVARLLWIQQSPNQVWLPPGIEEL